MKAAVLVARKKIEIQDVSVPAITFDDDVLVRVKVVGICGSDVHYFSEEQVGGERVGYPVIPGHECAGIVEKTGSAVSRLKPGDRVAIEPAVSCLKCDQCLTGRFNTCRKISFLGHKNERQGALAEFLVIPERNCYRLEEDISLTQATLAEPFSIALHAVNLAGGLKNKNIAILGSGPIGLSLALAAKTYQAQMIFATDIVPHRVKAALTAGALWAGNPHEQDIIKEILKIIPEGLDFVFECCGEQDALTQAVDLLKPGGTLLLVGIPVQERFYYPTLKARRKELRFQNVRRQNECLEEALALIRRKKVDVDFMATNFFPLEKAQTAFETALGRKNGVIKALITV